jgi:hypothetical protein
LSVETRLQKVMPALSAKERGLLVLGCLKEGTPEDPLWRKTMPPNQVREFNQFIDLMNVANIQLAAEIAVLEQAAETIEMRECWLISIVLWQEHLVEIHRAVQQATRDQKRLARLVEAFDWRPLEAFGKAGGGPSRLRSLREALADTLARHVIACWQQVRACEIVLTDIAAWFDATDPLKPVSREALNETLQKLSRVRDHLAALDKECELSEPPEEVVDALRGVVRRFEPGF